MTSRDIAIASNARLESRANALSEVIDARGDDAPSALLAEAEEIERELDARYLAGGQGPAVTVPGNEIPAWD